MKKISTSLAITIIVILSIILIGGIFIYQYRFSLPEIPFIPKPGVSFSNDCNELIQQINNLVEKANYCNVDSDCLISTEVTKFCGCWGLINKNADLSKINVGQAKYGKLNCPILMCGECMLLPQQDDIKCVNNKCADARLVSPKEKACVDSGGQVITTRCYCGGVEDFFSTCEIGTCSCNPAGGIGYSVKICDCGRDECFNGNECVPYSSL